MKFLPPKSSETRLLASSSFRTGRDGFLLALIAAVWLITPSRVWVGDLFANSKSDGHVEESETGATAGTQQKPKRLLLLGQGPDGHPWSTHEYMAGVHIVAGLMQPIDAVQTVVVQADGDWEQGPELIDGADGVVLFLSEGAAWISQNPKRLQALQRLAQRGGAFVSLHWGMGTRDAQNIDAFVELFGGCHGGPDRKYKVVDVRAEPASKAHPILRGIAPFDVHDEFYYRLKFGSHASAEERVPLLHVPIDGEPHPVAWAWERPDEGRSFGFSGLHFHRNWELPEYRRLVKQGILWTLSQPIPEEGINATVPEALLKLAPRDEDGS